MKKTAFILLILFAAAVLFGCAAPKNADTSKPYVAVSFTYAANLRYAPSYAVWVQSEDGVRATLFTTGKAAANSYGGTERPSALPVWMGLREDKVDAVSGATPAKEAKLTCNIPESLAGKKLKLFIEANASYDYNDYYKEALKTGEQGYNDVNGQPSVVWMAELDPSAVRGEASPSIIGAGDVFGRG